MKKKRGEYDSEKSEFESPSIYVRTSVRAYIRDVYEILT